MPSFVAKAYTGTMHCKIINLVSYSFTMNAARKINMLF